MADRDYRVVYKSRTRDRDSYEAEYDDRRYGGDKYGYDDGYGGPRRSGDALERVSTRSEHGSVKHETALAPRRRHNTRSEYDFIQDRDDLYARPSNMIVLDSRDRDLAEWEIIRPERTESGAIVIDTGAPYRGYGYDDRRPRASGREIEIITGGQNRSIGRSRSIVDAMREVRVTEEDDDRRSVYSRGGRGRQPEVVEVPIAPRRMPSAVRHEHSPESISRRRTRSIGFHKSQIREHDATEARHERPGAEAALAGQYLIGHRGERLDEDYDGHASQVSRAQPRDRSRRRHRRHHDDDDEYDYTYEKRDRYYEEGINRDFDKRSRPYSPQRAPSPEPEPEPEPEPARERRHRRHRHRHRRRERSDEEDDRSYVSERYRKVEREYRD